MHRTELVSAKNGEIVGELVTGWPVTRGRQIRTAKGTFQVVNIHPIASRAFDWKSSNWSDDRAQAQVELIMN